MSHVHAYDRTKIKTETDKTKKQKKTKTNGSRKDLTLPACRVDGRDVDSKYIMKGEKKSNNDSNINNNDRT